MTPVIAWRLVPSKNAPDKFNVKNADGLNMSVDPMGAISWSQNDQNYEQFTRNGLAVEVAPGSDQNPHAPTFVIFPS